MKLLQPRRFDIRKFAWVLLVLIGYVLYTTRRDRPETAWKWTGPAFGSTYTVQVVSREMNAGALRALRSEVEACLDDINRHMSTWLPDSDLSRFNASTSTAAFAADTGLVAVTRAALDLSRKSGGAFDCTFAPMFALWGFGAGGPKHTPADEAIAETLKRCGFGALHTPDQNSIQKDLPTLQYNLNAIAPGYAADRVADILRGRGFTNIYIEVGGEVLVRGHSARGDRWRIGLESPRYDEPPGEEPYKVLEVSGWAVATSGDYRSYGRDSEGRVFSHIFDPRQGRPATSHVASVTVLAPDCMSADGIATTLFVMGPEAGIPWLTNVPPAQALFLTRDAGGDLIEIASPGFGEIVSVE